MPYHVRPHDNKNEPIVDVDNYWNISGPGNPMRSTSPGAPPQRSPHPLPRPRCLSPVDGPKRHASRFG
jgi:hypothetical protein